MKLVVFGGKANSGKDTSAEYLDRFYEEKGLKVVNIQIAYYIKMYAKQIGNWDGAEDTKPRDLLQRIGTEVIRNTIDKDFFIKRILEDIEVYSHFFDVITISDARFHREFDKIRKKFPEAYCVHVTRPNYVSRLTAKQKAHATEAEVDTYPKYDYELVNDGTLEDLEKRVKKLMKEVDKHEKND